MMPDLDFMLRIAALEAGLLPESEAKRLFADLVNNGMVWKMNRVYQKTAMDMIKAGMIEFKN